MPRGQAGSLIDDLVSSDMGPRGNSVTHWDTRICTDHLGSLGSAGAPWIRVTSGWRGGHKIASARARDRLPSTDTGYSSALSNSKAA